MKNVQDFFHEIRNIGYGWHDKDGNVHESLKGSKEGMILQDSQTIIEDNHAVCWEMCELQRDFFKQSNIEYKNIFVYLNDPNHFACHTFSIFKHQNKWFWFEASWINKKGIHEFDSIKEILDLAHVLKMSKELSMFYDEITKNIDYDFNSLKSFFNNLYLNIDLEKEIFIKIIDENTIDDRASDTLYSIRKSRKSLEQNIKDKLNHFIHSSTYSKYLMEPIITIRDNRFVIPVKDEYRSQISGLIHDISSSGSTVFIEPTSIFDMNNEINTLKIKENIEIEKILSSLSEKLSLIRNELENNVRLLGIIDFIFAKANYAKDINGISPIINDKKEFNLMKINYDINIL